MPPWLPEPGHGDFQDERRLTDAQIRTIGDWVQARRAGGTRRPMRRPRRNSLPDGSSARRTWCSQAPGRLSRCAPTVPDDYWNFVLPAELAGTRWVKAIEIRPGNARAVHHANVLIDRSRSREPQEKTPGAGFPGMDLNIEADTFDPDSHFLFWKPGGIPWEEPDGMAWRADPGNDLVLNVHMQPTGKPEVVQPSVGLYFTDRPGTKFPMLVQLEHDGALDIPAGRPRFPGQRRFPRADGYGRSGDLSARALSGPAAGRLRHPARRQAQMAHPHSGLGRELAGGLPLPRAGVSAQGDACCRCASTTTIRPPIRAIRIHPPKRVRGGNQATDEMGHLWLQVLPRGAGRPDRRMELQEALMRHRLDKYPGDFSAHFNLGAPSWLGERPRKPLPICAPLWKRSRSSRWR